MIKSRNLLIVVSICILALIAGVGGGAAMAPYLQQAANASFATTFTYRGRLAKNSVAVSDTCDMRFLLKDGANVQVGSTIQSSVSVLNGNFAVDLDFGPTAFDGGERWLEVEVKCTQDADYTALSRQGIGAAPYATYAFSAGAIQGQPVSTNAPLTGQVLTWNGAAWEGQTSAGHSSHTTTNTTTVLDSIGDVGQNLSMAIGEDGLGLISYYDATNGDLKVAHCSNAICSAATITTVDGAGGDDVGFESSLVIGRDGLGLIIYNDITNEALKAAHCSTPTCDTSTIYLMTSPGNPKHDPKATLVGNGSVLVIFAEGNSVSAFSLNNCNDNSCPGSSLNTLVMADFSSTINHVAVATRSDGVAMVAAVMDIHSQFEPPMITIDCVTFNCDLARAISDSFDYTNYSPIDQPFSMVTGVDGLPLIIAATSNGYVAAKLPSYSGINFVESFQGPPPPDPLVYMDQVVGGASSIAIGPNGLGMVVYYDPAATTLNMALCENLNCKNYMYLDAGIPLTPNHFFLESSANVGSSNAIALGGDGLPLIGYYDAANGNLKVLHCANAFCSLFP